MRVYLYVKFHLKSQGLLKPTHVSWFVQHPTTCAGRLTAAVWVRGHSTHDRVSKEEEDELT